jgi:hypothetical protein
MLDQNTVINVPHSDTDPRTSVTVQEQGAVLTLFFPAETALSGEAELLEVRLEPTNGEFAPWYLVPRLPLILSYARATIAFRRDDAAAALRALRKLGSTRRGLSDDHYRIVAQLYDGLVREGERHPVKALAIAQRVDISTASRWVSGAKQRGFVEAEKVST